MENEGTGAKHQIITGAPPPSSFYFSKGNVDLSNRLKTVRNRGWNAGLSMEGSMQAQSFHVEVSAI